jgi:transposase-like protein
LKNVKKVLRKRKRDLHITEFQNTYRTEKDCQNYLFKLKWPNGFICPQCGSNTYYLVEKRHLYQCTKCKKQNSITSGTLLHHTHLPLLKWFWAIYLVSRDKRGYSALALKNALNVSYPTAWLLFQKIRTAMTNKEKDYVLSVVAVIDDAYFGGAKKGKKRGRGTEKIKVLVAVSLNKNDHALFAKMEVVKNLEAETISAAITKMVESGSTLRSDAYKSLGSLKDYIHEVTIASADLTQARSVFKWLNIIVSNAKSSILGTYHGLPEKHLDRYLSEYCYRLNRRFCEHIIFGKLVKACIITTPITYAELTL